jgi:hypothetical protein
MDRNKMFDFVEKQNEKKQSKKRDREKEDSKNRRKK